jgi:hypothetical protein
LKYALIYKPRNQYLYLKEYGLDVLNLGINPKVYDTESLAKIALEEQLPYCLEKQRITHSNSYYGLMDHGKPKWYDERHKKKLTEKQKEKLHWFETCLVNWEKNKKFLDEFKLDDVAIVEL